MKSIPAGEFKARCLQVMDEVQRQGEPVVVTKRGKPVVKLVPAGRPAREIFDCLKGQFEIVGDIVGPITPGADWEYD